MIKSVMRWSVLLFLAQPVVAEVSLAPLFQNGGVLQRDKVVPVWGRAAASKAVTVTFGGQSKTTTADSAGRWQISLAPMPASSESRAMTITETGSPAVEVKDLLVGEVWLGSGQSNMEFKVGQTRKEDQEIAAMGPVPLLRLFDVPHVLSNIRQEMVNAKWTSATPENARDFSAVGYFFGKQLTEELKVPVGIIHSSWGGSRIEPWWAEEGFDGIEELAEIRNQRRA